MAANPVCPVLFLGAGSAGVRWAVPACGSACAIAAALVRHPESFCPLNKSKWIGSSYAGFAKTESRWLLEFKNIEAAFCKQEENAPSLGLSQSLVGSNGNMQKRHPAVPAGSLVPSALAGLCPAKNHAPRSPGRAEPSPLCSGAAGAAWPWDVGGSSGRPPPTCRNPDTFCFAKQTEGTGDGVGSLLEPARAPPAH